MKGEDTGIDVRVSRIIRVFLYSGATTFGGMWAATRKLEKDLVDKAGYLTADELRTSFLLATLIPSPKFLSLGGLVGFRVGGWVGSLAAVTSLLLPPSVLIVAAAFVLSPDLLDGPLAPLTRSISIAVVGLLFANALMQLKGSRLRRRQRVVGTVLSLTLFGSIAAGVPLIAGAVGGFVLGALLIRHDPRTAKAEA